MTEPIKLQSLKEQAKALLLNILALLHKQMEDHPDSLPEIDKDQKRAGDLVLNTYRASVGEQVANEVAPISLNDMSSQDLVDQWNRAKEIEFDLDNPKECLLIENITNQMDGFGPSIEPVVIKKSKKKNG